MATIKKYNGSSWENAVVRKFTTATEAVENPLYSDGSAITSYTIKGNTVQNGTPTPSNPVEVNGVGERTENLTFKTITQANINSSGTIIAPDNYTIAIAKVEQGKTYSGNGWLYAFYENEPNIGSTSYNGQRYSSDFLNVTSPIDGYVALRVTDASQPMINGGSQKKPFEPLGYKIPISSGQQTTNIYLGSTQTVRPIKKLVLTGEENWQTYQSGALTVYNLQYITDYLRVSDNICICSHYPTNDNVSGAADAQYGISFINNVSVSRLYLRDDNIATVSALQQYLADQYAAGTPVTIWYVLATPETGIVNEPLMKIGTYADTLSNATAIPTTEGANSITVDTTVQPSEFTATWTGWHNNSVKEYDGSDW